MVVFSTSHRWAKALAWSYQHYFKLLFFFPLHIPFALLLKHVVCFLLLLKDGLVYQRDRSNLWKIPEHSGENTPANHQEL